MQDRDEDYDTSSDYDRQSERLMENIAQIKEQYERVKNPPPSVDERYISLKYKLRESYVDSLYERLNKYFKNNDGVKDYNLFDVGEDGLVSQLFEKP